MSTPTHSDSSNDHLDKVLNIIKQLAKKSACGDYIYRGESECYEKVSSRLYREYQDINVENFNIEVEQRKILQDAKKYTTQTDEPEILSELQHYGGDTNLIDFTTDYLIALFFACDSSIAEDGRVVLLIICGSFPIALPTLCCKVSEKEQKLMEPIAKPNLR